MLKLESAPEAASNPLVTPGPPAVPDQLGQQEWSPLPIRPTRRLRLSREPLALFGKAPVHSVVATIRHLEGWQRSAAGVVPRIESFQTGKGLNGQITGLYEELRRLLLAREAGPETPNLEEEIAALLERISSLEVAEGEWVGRQFQDSLEMPIGSGARILQEIEEFLRDHEDPAAVDTTAESTDPPEA